MVNLADHVKDNFDGILVFGDVHADYKRFTMAADFAKSKNYFFMSLGDLVDRGHNPFEVVKDMHDMMIAKQAGIVIGNHDDKYHRFHHGAKVRFSTDGTHTLRDVGEIRMANFLKMYSDLQEMPGLAGMFHKFGDIVLVHAASHPDIWDDQAKFGSKFKARALYGEVTGEIHEDGYPIRYYNWIDEIPAGKTVIVGHDRKPIHQVEITEPLVVNNSNGGTAVFIDTSCGKGGFLTGAVIIHGKDGFTIDEYKEFK